MMQNGKDTNKVVRGSESGRISCFQEGKIG